MGSKEFPPKLFQENQSIGLLQKVFFAIKRNVCTKGSQALVTHAHPLVNFLAFLHFEFCRYALLSGFPDVRLEQRSDLQKGPCPGARAAGVSPPRQAQSLEFAFVIGEHTPRPASNATEP